MGTFSIILGIVAFLAFTGAGYLIAKWFVIDSGLMAMFAAYADKSTQMIIVITAVFGFIGLLVCVNLMMHGLTFMQVRKLRAEVKQLSRKVGKAGKAKKVAVVEENTDAAVVDAYDLPDDGEDMGNTKVYGGKHNK